MPRAHDPGGAMKSTPMPPTGATDQISILVVDDLPEKLLVYRTVLEELGENVVTAMSGSDALREVLRNEFAVILLDVNMPGMDGFETAELIRQRRKSSFTPIIFITAFTDEVRTAQGYAYGAVDYIQSPVVPEILRAKVKVFVELFRMRQEIARHAEQQIAIAEERLALVEERSRRIAAEEANRNLEFLAHASAVLGRSLDFETTVRDIARLPLPQFAKTCMVVLRESADAPWSVVMASSPGNPRERRPRSASVADGPPNPAAPADTGMRTGTRALLTEPLQDAVERVFETGEAESITSAGSPSLVLPLQVHGSTLGALILSQDGPSLAHTAEELTVLDNLASRSAMAIDNARLYLELKRADRHKSEFLATLSHELRNPLAPVRNAIQIVNFESVPAERRQWAIDVINRQMKHMTRLIDDLLDMSRITRNQLELKRETLQLSEIVHAAIESSRPLIEERGHRLTVDVPAEPLYLEADLTRLSQVFLNLLNNAAKYMEPGGEIQFTADREGSQVVVRVRDTGIGIPAEQLQTIFEMFMQGDRSFERSRGGLGIGLTLAKRLVEMHGGTISVSSPGHGHGTEFTLRLPLATGTPVPVEELPAVAPPPAGRPLRVLVADDNEDAADTLAMMLRSMGHETRVAYDGDQAVTASAEFRPDVAFLDVGMPRMNGIEACRRIREQFSGEPVVLIALTGWGQESDRRRTLEAGFNQHIVKPVDPDRVVGILAGIERPMGEARR